MGFWKGEDCHVSTLCPLQEAGCLVETAAVVGADYSQLKEWAQA